MGTLEAIGVAIASGLIVAIISTLTNRSIFKAIDEIKEDVRKIYETLREDIPTKENCQKESETIIRMDTELNLHGKQLSGHSARIGMCERSVEKLQER